MKVIITGSSGDIGKHIKKVLMQNYNTIEIVDPSSSDIDLSKDFNFTEYNVDGLIYCAGINIINGYNNIKESDMIKMMNVNAFGFVRMCKKIKFNKYANVIAIGSLYSTETRSGRLAYAMSKHAMLAAVKTLAIEMSDTGICVNMISPGFVDTELTRTNNTKNRLDLLNDKIPLGMTKSQEVANVCNFILSNNTAITGQNIIIDGGYSLIGV